MLVPPANNLWLVGRGEAELAAAPPSPNPPNKIQLEKEKSDFCVCLCNSNRKRPARPGRGGEGTVGGGGVIQEAVRLGQPGARWMGMGLRESLGGGQGLCGRGLVAGGVG